MTFTAPPLDQLLLKAICLQLFLQVIKIESIANNFKNAILLLTRIC